MGISLKFEFSTNVFIFEFMAHKIFSKPCAALRASQWLLPLSYLCCTAHGGLSEYICWMPDTPSSPTPEILSA